MTYVQAIENAINGNITDEVHERLEALKAQLEKRNSVNRKPTKTQIENEGIKAQIVEYLADGEGKQCKTIAKACGISVNKASALLRQLIEAKTLDRYIEKRVSYFKVAEGE